MVRLQGHSRSGGGGGSGAWNVRCRCTMRRLKQAEAAFVLCRWSTVTPCAHTNDSIETHLMMRSDSIGCVWFTPG